MARKKRAEAAPVETPAALPLPTLVRVKMTQSMAGPEISLAAGQVHSCGREEAARLIQAGFAVPLPADATETR